VLPFTGTHSAHTSWTTDATDTADTTYAPWTADTTHTANAAWTPNTSYTTHTTDAAWTAHSTDATDAADTTHTANAAYAADTANAANATHSADAADTAWTTGTAGTASRTIAAPRTIAAVEIVIAVEVVVDIHINISTAPAASPAPAAPCGSPCEADTKPYDPGCPVSSGAIIIGRIIDRWVRVPDRSVRVYRIIRRHVNDLWIGRLDDDHLLAFDHLSLDLHLVICNERPFIFRLCTHSLHGIHYILLLGEKCVAEIGRPLNVLGKPFDHVRKRSHRLNAWVPRLLRNRVVQFLLVLSEFRVFLKPLVQLDQLERIRTGYQDLGEQIVWIECDRCYECIELFSRDRS
jgi:hypothetical protein